MNHSTTAPATASRKMRNGTPSRRSSLARVSLPSRRAPPPTMCASPSHAPEISPGSAGGGVFEIGSFLVGALRLVEVDLARVVVVRALPDRDVPLVLVAMGSRYPRAPSKPGR